MNVFDKEHTEFAKAALKLPADEVYELVYQSLDVPFVYDPEDVAGELAVDVGSNAENITISDVKDAVSSATQYIRLPKGFRLVGLKHPQGARRVYGIVDFNSIENSELAE